MLNLLWLLLPLAAASGWYLARREYRQNAVADQKISPSEYVKGLNFLLNEQSDKAIDVFVKMLETDEEVIEMHLAVGSLFRQRGEVERAIRIHQNLVARPGLSEGVRGQALLELARDYLRAGLLDRTEDLCLEIIDSNDDNLSALHILKDIYEQEKEWFRAIEVGRKIQAVTPEFKGGVIAQYFCELAVEAKDQKDLAQARRMLEKAFAEDPFCGRAAILLGDIEKESENYAAAIAAYRRLEESAPQYLSEIYASILECYEAMHWQKRIVPYLRGLLDRHHGIELVLVLSRVLKEQKGVEAALDFLSGDLAGKPSLRGISCLFELESQQTRRKRKFSTLAQQSLDRLLENKPTYRCANCGFTGVVMHWNCPSCKQWGTINAIQEFQWGASI